MVTSPDTKVCLVIKVPTKTPLFRFALTSRVITALSKDYRVPNPAAFWKASPGARLKHIDSAAIVVVEASMDQYPIVDDLLSARLDAGKPTILIDHDGVWAYRDSTSTAVFTPRELTPSFLSLLLFTIERLIAHADESVEAAPGAKPTPTQLADRIEGVAASLADLRINSISGEIAELQTISEQLRSLATEGGTAVEAAAVAASTRKALPVLSQLYDTLGSKQATQLIVAGAVAGIMSIGGWPAVAAYGLGLAAWKGKDAFNKAVEAFIRKTDTPAE